jgi:hypothetical protein
LIGTIHFFEAFKFYASKATPFPYVQVQILRQARTGFSAKSVSLLAYPALPGHLQMWGSAASCYRPEGHCRFLYRVRRHELDAPSLSKGKM